MPTLDAAEVHVWFLDLSTCSPAFLNTSQISVRENQRAERLGTPLDRDRFVAGRNLTRRVVSAYSGEPPLDVAIEVLPNGKPRLTHPASLRFNLSHSGNRIVVAVTHQVEVGVDVQQALNVDWRPLANQLFTESERQWLDDADPPAAVSRFYQIWTRKEAIAKAMGSGFRIPLVALDVISEPDVARHLPSGSRWHVCDFQWESGAYRGAVAVPNEPLTLELFDSVDL